MSGLDQDFTSKSFITKSFEGQLSSTLSCPACPEQSTTSSPLMCLSLPLPALPGPQFDLDDCFDKFLEEETLEQENAWYCEKCNKLQQARKKLAITQLPDLLIIHLKRFATTYTGTAKLDGYVQIPHCLDLNYDPAIKHISSIYHLYAVCNHIGDTLKEGHYTAVVQNSDKKGWNLFNDSKVTPIAESEVVVSLIHG